PAEVLKRDLHHVTILQCDTRAKAEGIGTKEVDVGVSGTAVSLVFEMMMLEITHRVRHLLLTASNRVRPKLCAVALDPDSSRHTMEVWVDHKLRPHRAVAQLGMGEIEIILLFENMIGELIGHSHPDAARPSISVNHVHTSDFWFFAAIASEIRHYQRFSMGPNDGSRPLVKPFRRDADFSGP